jgi:hypothetical protein
MTYEEKGIWVYLVASAGAYVVYLVIVLGRVLTIPVAEVSYVPVLLGTCLVSMVAATVGRTVVETARPSEGRRRDVRDKEIYRFGEYVSRWFVIGAAAAAFFMAVAKVDYFWIANVIYLGFVLWAVVGSAMKLVAYRRGL